MDRNSYHVQQTCENCAHVFVKYDWDSCSECYCTLGAEKRPLCGSCFMDESHYYKKINGKLEGIPDEEAKNNCRKWDKWEEENLVSSSGICSEYECKETL